MVECNIFSLGRIEITVGEGWLGWIDKDKDNSKIIFGWKQGGQAAEAKEKLGDVIKEEGKHADTKSCVQTQNTVFFITFFFLS